MAQVLTDNDISATTGRTRPGFEALLASNPRRMVVWYIDRLVRLSKDAPILLRAFPDGKHNKAEECPKRNAGQWCVTSVRRVLLNARTAGRVVSNGQDYGGNGLAILDVDTVDRLAARLRDPRRLLAPSHQVKHLLSGLVRCGRESCDGAVMFVGRGNVQLAMAYRCRSCSGTRRRESVDEVVMAAVVARLTRPDAAGLLDRDVDVDEQRGRVVDLRERRDGLASLLADGLLTPAAVRTQAQRLTDQISDLERQIEARSARARWPAWSTPAT